MSGKQKRSVNVIPNTRIKTEIVDDDEDNVNISCRICNKCFANEIALRNHARMEHIEAYSSGDPSLWTLKESSKKEMIKLKTEEMISSMAPADLMSLASVDVDYIIIKGEGGVPPTVQRKRKAEKPESEKAAKVEKAAVARKEKEVVPITGPLECLQPSVLVADGTCHQIFFSCCEYSVHFRDEHTRRRKGLRCQVCEKPLAGGDDQAPFSCEVCGAGFQANKELWQHMSTDHVKLKPFECSVCHKRFTQQGGVQQHMRMHTGDRPFSCTFCSKAFTQKSGLDQHLRIHTKVKPYRCVICSKTFCQSVHLRQHMRTHTNVSPFQCGICGKRFKQSSHLNYHLKNHNTAAMTDEQKTMYRRLLSLVAPEERQRSAVATLQEDGTVEVAVEEQELEEEEVQEEGEVQEDGEVQEEGEVQTEDMEYQEETVEESEVLLDEQEQFLAEQSIKVENNSGGEETYILSDVIDNVISSRMEEAQVPASSLATPSRVYRIVSKAALLLPREKRFL